MTELLNPENETWFIVWNDERTEILSHGSVLPIQVMKTKWTEVDFYLNENEYTSILLDNDITITSIEDMHNKILEQFTTNSN
jgi:hypothetical protein